MLGRYKSIPAFNAIRRDSILVRRVFSRNASKKELTSEQKLVFGI